MGLPRFAPPRDKDPRDEIGTMCRVQLSSRPFETEIERVGNRTIRKEVIMISSISTRLIGRN